MTEPDFPNFVEELRWRGMLYDMTEGADEILNKEKSNTKKLTPIVRKYKGILKNKINNDREEIVDYLIDKHR